MSIADSNIIVNIVLAILAFVVAYILGLGVGPILAELKDLTTQKKIEAFTRTKEIEQRIAQSSSLPKTLIHDVASSIDVQVSDPWVVSTADVLSQGLQALRQILPVKDERISPEEVAEAADQVADFIKRLTDNVAGNLPDIEG